MDGASVREWQLSPMGFGGCTAHPWRHGGRALHGAPVGVGRAGTAAMGGGGLLVVVGAGLLVAGRRPGTHLGDVLLRGGAAVRVRSEPVPAAARSTRASLVLDAPRGATAGGRGRARHGRISAEAPPRAPPRRVPGPESPGVSHPAGGVKERCEPRRREFAADSGPSLRGRPRTLGNRCTRRSLPSSQAPGSAEGWGLPPKAAERRDAEVTRSLARRQA
jgi:hypothetical protein